MKQHCRFYKHNNLKECWETNDKGKVMYRIKYFYHNAKTPPKYRIKRIIDSNGWIREYDREGKLVSEKGSPKKVVELGVSFIMGIDPIGNEGYSLRQVMGRIGRSYNALPTYMSFEMTPDAVLQRTLEMAARLHDIAENYQVPILNTDPI